MTIKLYLASMLNCGGDDHSCPDLPRKLAALTRASVPAVTPGYGHRVMFRFFAPYVPVDIAVPVDHEGVARKVLSME